MTYPADQYPSSLHPDYRPIRPTNVLAIIALVSSFFVPPAGIVCGHLALGQIRRTGEAGNGLAVAGLVLGYVFSGLIVLVLLGSVVVPLVLFGILGAASAGL